MALDYQKTYNKPSGVPKLDVRRSKTTYGEMNFWQDSAVDSEKVAVEQQLGIPVPDNRLPLDPHVYGAPRARRGKQGGGWSNVSEVLLAEGQRIVYVKGSTTARNTRSKNEELMSLPLASNVQAQSMISKPVNTKMTAADMLALKASESGNWHVMR